MGAVATQPPLGICSRVAGWGGCLLNVVILISVFPPANNPVFDA